MFAVTNTINLVAWNHTNWLTYSLGSQKSEILFTGLKSRYRQNCIPLEALGENSLPCFSISSGCLRCLPHGPSSIFRINHPNLCFQLLPSFLFSPFNLILLPPSSHKDLFDYTGSICIIQDYPPHLKILNQSPLWGTIIQFTIATLKLPQCRTDSRGSSQAKGMMMHNSGWQKENTRMENQSCKGIMVFQPYTQKHIFFIIVTYWVLKWYFMKDQR